MEGIGSGKHVGVAHMMPTRGAIALARPWHMVRSRAGTSVPFATARSTCTPSAAFQWDGVAGQAASGTASRKMISAIPREDMVLLHFR